MDRGAHGRARGWQTGPSETTLHPMVQGVLTERAGASRQRIGPGNRRSRARERLRALRRRATWRRVLLISALLHLGILLALILSQRHGTDARTVGEPASVDVVVLPPGTRDAPPAPVPEPHPTTTVPPMPLPRPPAAPPVAMLPPAPEQAPAATPLPAPPLPAPPPPLPLPPPPPPQQEALAIPLPPLPRAPPAPARPAEPAFPRPIARSLADLGLGQRDTAAPARPASPPGGRGLNLALGPVARASNGAVPRNPDIRNGMVRVEGADLGEDWIRALHEWWDRHGYYPQQAAQQGEDGTSRVRVLVDRSGRVREVELEMRSGSQWLDVGSLAIFRNAMLPPFPPGTTQNQATLHMTLNFILIRGGR